MVKYVFKVLFIVALCFTIFNALEWTDRITASLPRNASPYPMYTILGLVVTVVLFVISKKISKKEDESNDTYTNLDDYFKNDNKNI